MGWQWKGWLAYRGPFHRIDIGKYALKSKKALNISEIVKIYISPKNLIKEQTRQRVSWHIFF